MCIYIYGVVLTLADHSSVFPKGVLEDALMQVNNIVFSCRFFCPRYER